MHYWKLLKLLQSGVFLIHGMIDVAVAVAHWSVCDHPNIVRLFQTHQLGAGGSDAINVIEVDRWLLFGTLSGSDICDASPPQQPLTICVAVSWVAGRSVKFVLSHKLDP